MAVTLVDHNGEQHLDFPAGDKVLRLDYAVWEKELLLWDMDSMDMGQSLRPILTASTVPTAFCSPNLDPYPDHPWWWEVSPPEFV